MTELSVASMEKRLLELPTEILEAKKKVIDAKQKYLETKATYKRDYALTILQEKAKNSELTQTDLEAVATKDNYDKYLEMIEAEAFYQGRVADKEVLEDGFTALRKIGSLRGVYQG